MLVLSLTLATAMIVLAAAITLWRMAKGPRAADRILALDTLAIDAIALVLIAGIATGTAVYFDAALLIAMTGFVGTVALAKFIIGGDIIE